MKNPRFLQIAAGLGIAVPACLLGLADDGEAYVPKIPVSEISAQSLSLENNPVKNRILKVYCADEQTCQSFFN